MPANPLPPHAEPRKAVVDMRTFTELLALPQRDKGLELLDQMITDVQSGYRAIEQAVPADDRMALRNQCHILIGVAGAIGATTVQIEAENLTSATQSADRATLTMNATRLLASMQSLLAFLQRECQARRLT